MGVGKKKCRFFQAVMQQRTGLVTSALIQLVSRQASNPSFVFIHHNPKNSVYELKIQSAYVDFLWHGRPGHDQSRASRLRHGMKTGFSSWWQTTRSFSSAGKASKSLAMCAASKPFAKRQKNIACPLILTEGLPYRRKIWSCGGKGSKENR